MGIYYLIDVVWVGTKTNWKHNLMHNAQFCDEVYFFSIKAYNIGTYS